MSSLYPRKKVLELANLLTQSSEENPVILVEGPRQVGKTTIIKECLRLHQLPHVSINLEQDLRYKAGIDSCEDFKDFTTWLTDTLKFKPGGPQILFIDEAQESQKLGKFVRSMKENWKNTHVVLSGSTMSRLFRGDTRYPVGRVKVITIQSFSFFEFLHAWQKNDWLTILEKWDFSSVPPSRHLKLLDALNTYIHVGGFPVVISEFLNQKDYKIPLLEIFESYRNDFIRVFGEEQGSLFARAMQAVADHVGSPSKLSQALDLQDPNYKQMNAIYSRLEAWHMIYLSMQRGAQPEGATSYHPKRYLFDMGLLNQLRTSGIPNVHLIHTMDPNQRRTLGGILENMVAFYLKYWGCRLAGWKKDPSGMEIDFVVKLKDKVIPIECKANQKVKETHLKGLKKYMIEYGLKEGIIVNLAPYQELVYSFGRIYSIPLYALESLPHQLNPL